MGTLGRFTAEDVEQYLSRVIVSRLNDFMGEDLKSILDLPGHYDEWSERLRARLTSNLDLFSIALIHLYVNAIMPPPEVQQAIDDRSKLALFGDLDRLLKLKAAVSREKAAENPGAAGKASGLGLAFMMPGLLDRAFASETVGSSPSKGEDQSGHVCPDCGHHLVVFDQCPYCGKNVPPHARFCQRCGNAMSEQPAEKKCRHYGAVKLPQSVFCDQCGERL